MSLSDEFTRITGRSGFYNIMPIKNLPSVLQHGILSYEQVANMPHDSVAMSEIQSRRNDVCVPNGMMLHEYANVYFDARNPMLYKRRQEDICVLKISPQILELSDVVVADRNASSDYVRFFEPQYALDRLDFDLIYAEFWNDDDYFEYLKKKSIKCAELLVPYTINPAYIIAAAVKDDNDRDRLIGMGFNKRIYVDKHLFFG